MDCNDSFLTTSFTLSCIFTAQLPFSIRVLLESAIRNCDNFQILEKDVKNILGWSPTKSTTGDEVEVAFKPARVILQVRGLNNICNIVI